MYTSTSKLEEYFLDKWEAHFPELLLEREVKLIPGRAFRFDFAHIQGKVAIEINGGNYKSERGGHSTSEGLKRDYEKTNLVQLAGFDIFSLDTMMVKQATWYHRIALQITRNIENAQACKAT
jgi:hypothetical protein